MRQNTANYQRANLAAAVINTHEPAHTTVTDFVVDLDSLAVESVTLHVSSTLLGCSACFVVPKPMRGHAMLVRAHCMNTLVTPAMRIIYTTIVVQPSRRWFAPLVRSKIVDTRTGLAFPVVRAYCIVLFLPVASGVYTRAVHA